MGQLRCLATELNHQVVRDQRGQQFFLHHLHALRANVLRIQGDFHVSNVVFHVVATGVVFTRLVAANLQRGHQGQRVVGQRDLMQQNLQRGVCGKIGVALAVFHAGLPMQSVRRLSGPLFDQRRLTHKGFESRLRQPKQNLVTFSDHRVSHAENSKPGIGHHNRPTRQSFGHPPGQLRFGGVVLAVHRTDFRRQRATALHVVSHQQQRHRPDRFAMLIGRGRERGLEFGSRFQRHRGPVQREPATSVEPRRRRGDQ